MTKVSSHFVRGNDPKKFASMLVNFMGKVIIVLNSRYYKWCLVITEFCLNDIYLFLWERAKVYPTKISPMSFTYIVILLLLMYNKVTFKLSPEFFIHVILQNRLTWILFFQYHEYIPWFVLHVFLTVAASMWNSSFHCRSHGCHVCGGPSIGLQGHPPSV